MSETPTPTIITATAPVSYDPITVIGLVLVLLIQLVSVWLSTNTRRHTHQILKHCTTCPPGMGSSGYGGGGGSQRLSGSNDGSPTASDDEYARRASGGGGGEASPV